MFGMIIPGLIVSFFSWSDSLFVPLEPLTPNLADDEVVQTFSPNFHFRTYKHCDKLFSEDRYLKRKKYFDEAEDWEPRDQLTDQQWGYLSRNCSAMRQHMYFPDKPLSRKEQGFPIAYAILLQDKPPIEQVMRQLQSIYWPQNVYCLYPEASFPDFCAILSNLVRCFPNVMIPDRVEDLQYPTVSYLNAVMSCYRLLAEYPVQWKYVQTWDADTFPLHSNLQMVLALKTLNGSQDISLERADPVRYVYDYRMPYKQKPLRYPKKGNSYVPLGKFHMNPIPPGNVVIYKNSRGTTFSGDFIRWMVKDSTAQKLLNWTQSQMVFGNEQYFGTLVHNQHLGAPGNFPGTCLYWYGFRDRPGVSVTALDKKEASTWFFFDKQLKRSYFYQKCHGQFTPDGICIFGAGNLPYTHDSSFLASRGFRVDVKPVAPRCQVEKIFRKTYLPRNQHFKPEEDLSFYVLYTNYPRVKYTALDMEERKLFKC